MNIVAFINVARKHDSGFFRAVEEMQIVIVDFKSIFRPQEILAVFSRHYY